MTSLTAIPWICCLTSSTGMKGCVDTAASLVRRISQEYGASLPLYVQGPSQSTRERQTQSSSPGDGVDDFSVLV